MSPLLSRVVTAIARGLNGVPSSGSGYIGSGVSVPHEPFAGAWQQNCEAAASAGTNILAFPAVFACVNIISSDIAKLPVLITRPSVKGGRETHFNHPGSLLFAKINPYQTLLQFLQHYYTSKLVWGNVYVLLLRDARGVPYAAYILNPQRVAPLVTDEGSVYYRLQDDDLNGVNKGYVVGSRDIVHDRGICLFHPLVGVSPLFAAAVTAMLGARIITNSEKFFSNMSRAGGVLSTPNKIDPKVARTLQNEWEQNFSRGGVGKTAVLSNGLVFNPLQMPAVDAQLIEQLRWTEQNIAAAFRVPTFKLGELNKVNYRNSETVARDYYQGCLSYHLTGFEQCWGRALELATDVRVEYDLKPLFRTETDTRYAAYQLALNAGFLSINEVRAEEGYGPVEGGNEPRVQAQYIPLSLATGLGVNVPGAPAPAPAPAPADPPAPDASKAALIFLEQLMKVPGEHDAA